MRLCVQFLLLCAVILVLTNLNGVEGKKNKQKHGRSQDRSPAKAKSGYNKENSRKVRDVNNEAGYKEKYNKKEEMKYTSKQTKKIDNNQSKDKKNSNKNYVDRKYETKQEKKQGKQSGKKEYVEGKENEKYTKGKKEKVVVEEEKVIVDGEEEFPVEENGGEGEKELMMNEEKEEVVEESGKGTEDKLVQCKKRKTDSVERNTTETCQKYKSEKNLKVVEQTVIEGAGGEKTPPPAVSGAGCDACGL